MKVAVLSDIHDNLARLNEALAVCHEYKLSTAICCGDVTSIETLEKIAESFETVYLALGNADFRLAQMTGLMPGNVKWFSIFGAFTLAGKKIAVVHHPDQTEEWAKTGKYDVIFYGHTHTPWEKKVGRTQILNPGEISGQFGPASFCIYDLGKLSGQLIRLK